MPRKPPYPGYVIAIAAVAAAALVRALVHPLTGPQYFYAPYFVAGLLVARYSGTGPAIVAFALGLCVAEASLALTEPSVLLQQGHLIGVPVYCLTGFTAIAVVDSQRRARERAETSEEAFNFLAECGRVLA